MIYRNVLEMIGNTPIIKINKFNKNKDVNIFAKLEGANPGGSIKDRVALRMIEAAEKSGELSKGKVIIEATSGNTGIALAMIGGIKGYKVEIVMSKAVSIERVKMIKSFGAKIILTDEKLGTDGAILKTRELVKNNSNKYYNPDQFSNDNNKLAHYENTAKEIISDMNGKIDYFVSSIGTSGTLMGISRYLKEYDKNIKIISVEPEKNHYIQGLKNMEEAIVPAIYNKSKIDEILIIKSEDAFKTAREVVVKEGIFVGMSSGAAMWGAMEVAKRIKRANIVTIFPDRGEKYLSTKLFDFN